MEKEHRRKRKKRERMKRGKSFIIAFFAAVCKTLALMFILF
jgi:hypothetical protein